MANNDIIQGAATDLKAKLAQVDVGIETLEMGGKSVMVGGTQYTQENLDVLQRKREKLTAQMRQLVRRASR